MDNSPQFQHRVEIETGLRLPDGTEVWPPDTWHGHQVTTPESRQRLLEAITISAANLGMIPEDLTEQYRWIVREKHLYITTVCDSGTEIELDSPLMLPVTDAPHPGVGSDDAPESVVSANQC
jgi:hypothetical protein